MSVVGASHAAVMGWTETKLRSVHRAYLSILSDSHPAVDPSLALRHDHPVSLHQA